MDKVQDTHCRHHSLAEPDVDFNNVAAAFYSGYGNGLRILIFARRIKARLSICRERDERESASLARIVVADQTSRRHIGRTTRRDGRGFKDWRRDGFGHANCKTGCFGHPIFGILSPV